MPQKEKRKAQTKVKTARSQLNLAIFHTVHEHKIYKVTVT